MTRWTIGTVLMCALLVAGARAAAAAPVDESAIVCLECHAEMNPEVVAGWRRSVHYEQGVTCGRCHQMSDTDFDAIPAPLEGNHVRPDTGRTLAMCANCHKQWIDYYPLSAHFQQKRISCVMCHGGDGSNHAITRASLDIITPDRCTKCHTYDRAQQAKKAVKDAEAAYQDLLQSLEEIEEKGYHSTREAGYRDAAKALDERLPLELHTFRLQRIKEVTRTMTQMDTHIRGEEERIVASLDAQRRRQKIGVLVLVSCPLLSLLVLAYRQTFIDEWRAKYGPPPQT